MSNKESLGDWAFTMTNKYLTKIASHGISDDLRDPDFLRAGAKATMYGAVGAGIGNLTVGAIKSVHPNPTTFSRVLGGAMKGVATGVGLAAGLKSSFKNQTREQQLHDIKLQGAAQRQEAHELRIRTALQKHAQEVTQGDPNKLKKDLIGTGIIAGLGGVGSYAAFRALPALSKVMPKVSQGKLMTGLGTGIGLVADFAGLQASQAANKHIDKL